MKFQFTLLQNSDKRKVFKLELTNKFQALEELLQDVEVDTHWEKIKDIIMTAKCSDILGPKTESTNKMDCRGIT